MNFEESVDTIETQGSPGREVKFKQDTYQKSLRVLNQSSIALPTVKTKLKIRGAGSTLELLHNKDNPLLVNAHPHTNSMLTAGGSSQLQNIDGPSSIQLLKKNDSLMMEDSQMLTDALDSSKRHNTSMRYETQNPTELTTHNNSVGAVRNQAAIFRNSSTVEKASGSFHGSNIMDVKRRLATNSTSLIEPRRGQFMHNLNQSTRELPTSKILPNDYSTSVNILPVIGSEVSLEHQSNSQFSRINSKVELTKRDIQNFLVNGSISKQFIQSNKKELQKFIKGQARSTSEYFRGYQEYGSKPDGYTPPDAVPIKKNETIDNNYASASQPDLGVMGDLTAHLQRKLVGSSTIHVDANPKKGKFGQRQASQNDQTRSERLHGGDNNNMVFPNDVKLEHKFKGDSAQVSNRVLETWINETLTDAYHLEIPGVLTKPENQNPIYRYGIDRQRLLNAHISSDEIDRIYRSLFVYSVGFFELLKKILSTTQKNYQIITSIWKVFQVLLEYCCKTDYRILIAEITDKHQRELQQSQKEYKEKEQRYKNIEKVLKQNIETMTNYNDQLEKEKASEKQLRLKLEEEYMQNTKNHEEEVKLRLKFEGKFNTMHDTHRELQIRHDRTVKELEAAQAMIHKQEEEAKVRSDEFIDLQKVKVEQDSLIEQLKEYKQIAEKDIKKKNMTLRNAEQQRVKANENYELGRYDQQEAHKDLNDIKTKMEVQVTEIEHLRGVIQAQKVEYEEIELVRLETKGQYEKVLAEFESREGKIESLTGSLNAERQISKEYHTELEGLRKKINRLDISLGKVTASEAEKATINKQFKIDLASDRKELKSVQKQINQMNESRHKLLEELKAMTELSEQHMQQRDLALFKNQELREKMKKDDEYLSSVKMDMFRKEEEWNEQKMVFRNQKKDLEADIDYRKSHIDQLEIAVRKLQANLNETQTEGSQLKDNIVEYLSKISSLDKRTKEQSQAIEKLRTSLTKQENTAARAESDKQDALIAQNQAEEISITLTETVKTLQRRMREEKAQCNEMNELVYFTTMLDNERNMMIAEETVSRYGMMKAELQEALEEKQANRQKLEDYANLVMMLKNVETQRDQVIKELNNEKNKTEKLNNLITDKDAEIENEKERRVEALKEQKVEHNVEVNELEQKIQKERIEIANMKTAHMKEKREDRSKITELSKQVKILEKNGPPAKGKGAKRNSILADLTADKQSQTDAIKLPDSQRMLKKKKLTKQGPGVQSQGTISQELLVVDSKSKQSKKETSISLPSQTDNQTNSNRQIGIDSSRIDSSDEDDEDDDDDTNENRTKTMSIREGQHQGTQQSSRRRTSAKVSSTHGSTARKLAENTKAQEFIKWLVDEEKVVLEKIYAVLEAGGTVHPNQLKVWRGEMRIPAMYRNIKLDDDQLEEVEQLQQEQVDYYKERAERRIEEGSEYSSDFEEIGQSEYVDTDGGEEILNVEFQEKANIKVLRYDSIVPSPRGGAVVPGPLGAATKTGEFGEITKADQVVVNLDTEALGQGDESPKVKEKGNQELLGSGATNSLDVGDTKNLRVSAADKMINALRAQSARRRERARERVGSASSKGNKRFSHEIDDAIPVTQYMITKTADGKDQYKRRVMVQKRVKKERTDEYFEAKRAALELREKRQTANDMKASEQRLNKYKSMFANFAANYAKTLETLVIQSKQFLARKAQDRRKMGKNEDVDNIPGRDRNHFLMKAMRDTPAWEIHLAKLKDELVVQEDKWDHREDEKLEIEKKKEEIRALEEKIERDRSLERRKRTVVVREDLVENESETVLDQETHSNQEVLFNDMLSRGEPTGWMGENDSRTQSPNLLLNAQIVTTSPKRSVRNAVGLNSDPQHMQADLDQLSVWSEEALNNALSQRDAQNPQGEEEEIKESQHLQLMLQESRTVRQTQGVLDNELSQLTKGGVAAINRQQAQQRIQQESMLNERQMNAETRAHDKDVVLMQRGMLPKKPEEVKKKPAKLGPSTIRTLIRAAESRKD